MASIENITIKIGKQIISMTHEEFLELRDVVNNALTPMYTTSGFNSANLAPSVTTIPNNQLYNTQVATTTTGE